MADNQDTQTQDNVQTQTQDHTTQQTTQQTQTQDAPFTWKANLEADIANSPTIKKFPDTREGFREATKSHLNLEKLLGNEKVPIPKDKNDVAARAVFNKALGVPEKADGYKLADIEVPNGVKGSMFDKTTFAQIAHENNLTPEQTEGLWNKYGEMTKGIYAKAVENHTKIVTDAITQLKKEWGDAYNSKIELGQMVINKFAPDQAMNDKITALLIKDPDGIKFLATLGEQFAENKIGDFKYARHALTPEEAQKEITNIQNNKSHPYNDEKAPKKDRDAAIEYVLSLYAAINRTQG